MSTLITGGTGLIGSYAIKRLVTQGEVLVAYDHIPDMALLEAVLGADVAMVDVVRGDVLDLPFLMRTAREYEVQKVVHLAYLLAAQTEQNPALATRVNVEGTNNVLEMAGSVGVRRVVWASSIGVFGPKSAGPGGVVGADAPWDPETVYGACKVTNEVTARCYAKMYGLEPIGLRFPVVYGPEVRRGWSAFLPNLAASLVQGKRHPVVPLTDHPVNWGYVEDMADAVMIALSAPPQAQGVYTLAGFEATVREVVNVALAMFPGVEAIPMEGYPMPSLRTRFDASPVKSALGWEPKVTVEEGVRRIVNHYRALLRVG